jgi:hypothetical protein
VHSVDVSLTFADDGIKLIYGAQFLPETPIGLSLSYKPGLPPTVARYVSADALAAFVGSQNPQACADLVKSILNILTAVDYPPVSNRLKESESAYIAMAAESNGGGVGAFNLNFAQKDGRRQVRPEFFYVLSGHFSKKLAGAYFKNAYALNKKFSDFMLANFKTGPGGGFSGAVTDSSYAENALVVDGVAFDSVAFTTSVKGDEKSKMTEYIGTAGGNLVIASSETALEEHLPGLIARTVLADGIRMPDAPDEIARLDLNGGKLVEFLADADKLDLTDEDTRAQIDDLKAAFADGGPVSVAITAGQAKGGYTLSIPYKFIAATIHLVEYMKARNLNFATFAPQPPPPPPPPETPMPPLGGATTDPNAIHVYPLPAQP